MENQIISDYAVSKELFGEGVYVKANVLEFSGNYRDESNFLTIRDLHNWELVKDILAGVPRLVLDLIQWHNDPAGRQTMRYVYKQTEDLIYEFWAKNNTRPALNTAFALVPLVKEIRSYLAAIFDLFDNSFSIAPTLPAYVELKSFQEIIDCYLAVYAPKKTNNV